MLDAKLSTLVFWPGRESYGTQCQFVFSMLSERKSLW